MSTKDILKLIAIALIVISCIVTILLIFSEKYILNHVTVAEMNVKEKLEDEEISEILSSEDSIIEPQIPLVEQTPTATPEIPIVKPTETVIQEPNLSQGIYYIKVNNQMNTVTIYIKDENGNYTIPVKAMICSTGEATPKNCTYKLNYKRWKWRFLFGDVYGQYATHINGDILFHSVPYLESKNDTLEYWEYDKLGSTASAGCVRLTVEDAKWIFDNCMQGSIVEFYDSADPGPLGKPSAMKISNYEEYRNWDPTDTNENNPWNNIL